MKVREKGSDCHVIWEQMYVCKKRKEEAKGVRLDSGGVRRYDYAGDRPLCRLGRQV